MSGPSTVPRAGVDAAGTVSSGFLTSCVSAQWQYSLYSVVALAFATSLHAHDNAAQHGAASWIRVTHVHTTHCGTGRCGVEHWDTF